MNKWNGVKIEKDTYDVVVVGGGTSGCIAALRAAMQGLRVLVVERNTTLTGTMANSLVQPMMPSFCPYSKTTKIFIDALTNYVGKPLRQADSQTVWYNADDAHFVMSNLFDLHEVDVLYNAIVIDAVHDNHHVRALKLLCFNQFVEVETKMVVDASGDAVVARLLGITTSQGDEHNHNQEVTLRYEIGNVNIEQFRLFLKSNGYTFNTCDNDAFFEFVRVENGINCLAIENMIEHAISKNEIKGEDVKYIQAFSIPSKPHVLTFNAPQIQKSYDACNPIALSQYVRTGHQMQVRMFQFFKKYVPGFENAYINKTANNLGIRESYRIHSLRNMTYQDYLQREKFEDGIARGDWYVDVHSSKDELVENKAKYDKNEYYEISYRSLVNNQFNNYIACGRHIGSDFLMQSSIRIQLTLMAVGDACGHACAYSKEHAIDLNKIEGKNIKGLVF